MMRLVSRAGASFCSHQKIFFAAPLRSAGPRLSFGGLRPFSDLARSAMSTLATIPPNLNAPEADQLSLKR
jgi:hypothetical protein